MPKNRRTLKREREIQYKKFEKTDLIDKKLQITYMYSFITFHN